MEFRLYKNKDGSQRLMANVKLSPADLKDAYTDAQGNVYVELFAGPFGSTFDVTKKTITSDDKVVAEKIEAVDGARVTVSNISHITLTCGKTSVYTFKAKQSSAKDVLPDATKPAPKATEVVGSEAFES